MRGPRYLERSADTTARQVPGAATFAPRPRYAWIALLLAISLMWLYQMSKYIIIIINLREGYISSAGFLTDLEVPSLRII